MKMKITPSKLRYFMNDERKAIKEYKHYGLKGLARDEAKHLRFLKIIKR